MLLDWIRVGIRRITELVTILLNPSRWGKSDVFYVARGRLRDNDRNDVILRGVNLPLLDDWDFPGSDRIAQVAKSGANAVRIQWYAQYPNPQRPAYTVAHLDAILEKCRTNRLIPIVELHDLTCEADAALLNSQLVPWWTSTEVVKVLKRHQRYLIINLANELGVYRWQGNSDAALTVYKNAYKAAITSIRAKGLRMPIMIDAPDCGTSLSAFTGIGTSTGIGKELVDHDPRRSVLLSVHAYWAGDYDGTSAIAGAVQAGLPIIFGEVANKQADGDDQCYYALDGTGLNNPAPSGFLYQNLLALLSQLGVGWLAWAWYKDSCAARCITPDGNITVDASGGVSGLTPYGNDILNHPTYGIRSGTARAVRSASLPGAPPPP